MCDKLDPLYVHVLQNVNLSSVIIPFHIGVLTTSLYACYQEKSIWFLGYAVCKIPRRLAGVFP